MYSIAVFQHIDPSDWFRHLDEFASVLRPGGRGIWQVAVATAPVAYRSSKGLRTRCSLRFKERTSEEVTAAFSDSGFVDVRISPIVATSHIDDEVGTQHLATFCKPA